jgi:hypothetical protein
MTTKKNHELTTDEIVEDNALREPEREDAAFGTIESQDKLSMKIFIRNVMASLPAIFLIKRPWVRILTAVLSVVIPVVLVGAIIGWNRTTKELGGSMRDLTFIAILLPASMIAAFFAGYYLIRGKTFRRAKPHVGEERSSTR